VTAGIVAGLAVVAAGGVLTVWRRSFVAGLWTQAAGAALLAVTGFAALLAGSTAGASFTSELEPQFGVDGLTAFFLGILGVVAAPALAFSTAYLRDGARDRAVAVLTAAFVVALAAVLCARDPLTFLGFWEAMTLLPAAVILVAHGAGRSARKTVYTYVSITHLGGAGTWIAILLLAEAGAVGDPSAISTGSATQIAIAIAALVGMGTKAGVMPLHVWLPRAHPIAPAPVSALMSGVMIKVAIYALVRVLVEWLGVLPAWIGVLVLALGAFSAVGGVVYALFQHDLKRLLALHSIENIGIIVLGLGACLLLRERGASTWAAFALAAALLHTLNHAVFKALLFLGAGAFEKATGSLELDRLGGLLRRMPWTAGAFLVGAMAIAGLPPLNGFASEWLTLQALLHVPSYGGIPTGVAGAIALAALASTAALAVFCFVKVVGLVLLGRPRRHATEVAADAAVPMRAAVVALAIACVALGVAPGLLFGALVGLAPWAGDAPVHVGLPLPGTGSLPTGGIAIVLVGIAGALVLLRGRRAAEPAPSWACGQLAEPQLEWTSAGFTKPLRLVLEAVLRPQREVTVRTAGGVVQEVSYAGRVPHLIDEHVYEPATKAALAGAALMRRLQSGRLGAYVLYLVGLVVVLLGAARLGVIG
jgi:hydrogenase-4 component B